MTPDEVREIVREEIDRYHEERIAVERSRLDQIGASMREFHEDWMARAAPEPRDGPVVASIKKILRGESEQ